VERPSGRLVRELANGVGEPAPHGLAVVIVLRGELVGARRAFLKGLVHNKGVEWLIRVRSAQTLVPDRESAGRSRRLWSSSQWTLSWREMDSNFRFRASDDTFQSWTAFSARATVISRAAPRARDHSQVRADLLAGARPRERCAD
jgi:hypothetical protein